MKNKLRHIGIAGHIGTGSLQHIAPKLDFSKLFAKPVVLGIDPADVLATAPKVSKLEDVDFSLHIPMEIISEFDIANAPDTFKERLDNSIRDDYFATAIQYGLAGGDVILNPMSDE